MQWIEANGASLRCELAGDAPRTLVLIHEAGGAMESWDELMPGLQRHFRTLRYDQRGFGLSEKFRGELSVESVVADLVGLLDALDIREPVSVLGGAFGAVMGIAFAARHPQRVARLVACILRSRSATGSWRRPACNMTWMPVLFFLVMRCRSLACLDSRWTLASP